MKINSKKFLIILFSCIITVTCIFLISSIFLNIKTDEKILHQTIKNITQNTKLIDANTDHNQALDVTDYAKSHDIKIPSILINFDTHSDIYINRPLNPTKGAGVEDWINEFLLKNPEVQEVYWVMPIEEILYPDIFLGFFENKQFAIPDGHPLLGNSVKENITYLTFLRPIFFKPYKQTFLLNTKNGILNEYEPKNKFSNSLFNQNDKYRKVTIYTCTESSLPDFKNKKVFLSFDADYISNSGFDTTEDFTNNKNSKEIEIALYKMFLSINKKNIHPTIFSMSLSPRYLPEEDHPQLLKFFDLVFKISEKKDYIQKYTREYY